MATQVEGVNAIQVQRLRSACPPTRTVIEIPTGVGRAGWRDRASSTHRRGNVSNTTYAIVWGRQVQIGNKLDLSWAAGAPSPVLYPPLARSPSFGPCSCIFLFFVSGDDA